ncbi:MAG TPA: SRPBCC domain-containing protein [bacterium]|nr:SRPBCC domain-containing protein [bacterium]
MIRTGLIVLLVMAVAGTAAAGVLPDLSTHKDVRAVVEIKASADEVWRVLTDFPAYDIWNPYIYPASGDAVAGRTLDLTLRGGTVIHFAPTVLVAKPGQELTWAGKMPLGAVERVLTFEITPLEPHRSRLTATERFRGIALPLVSGVTDDAASGLAAMTRALRERAELLDFSLPVPR